MARGTYSYDPTKIGERGKDRMRFELGDTEVGGEGPASFTAQAICEMCERSTVSLRSSEAINLTDPSVQPLVTLSLVRI